MSAEDEIRDLLWSYPGLTQVERARLCDKYDRVLDLARLDGGDYVLGRGRYSTSRQASAPRRKFFWQKG